MFWVSSNFLKEVNEFYCSEQTNKFLMIHYDKQHALDAKAKEGIKFPFDFGLRWEIEISYNYLKNAVMAAD